ncbi:hypothetical protein BJV77DRAFT_962593 [Russula vinacea]|nr:hypothetical protein BJV77DRAFT_962593 [Russula vinacea]
MDHGPGNGRRGGGSRKHMENVALGALKTWRLFMTKQCYSEVSIHLGRSDSAAGDNEAFGEPEGPIVDSERRDSGCYNAVHRHKERLEPRNSAWWRAFKLPESRAGRDKLAALNRERSLPVAKKLVMLPWKVVNERLGPERKGTAYFFRSSYGTQMPRADNDR